MRRTLLTALIIACSFWGNAQEKLRSYLEDPGRFPRSHNVDMQHLKLEVEFEPEKGLVKGKVIHTFVTLQKQVDSLFLDGPGINILSAKLDGKDVRHLSGKAGITFYFTPLQWQSEHKLVLEYDCIPKKGIYFVGWNDPKNLSRKQIWTQGQGINNRHWIPMYDDNNDKVITETIIRFDSQYKVLSNGAKVKEKDNGNGTKTWHYKMSKPHSPYLMMIGIGDYKIRTAKARSGVELDMWYYPEWEARVDATYKYSVEMMDFLEEEIGVPYPWERYSQIPVQDFLYGAMENTTATIFGDFYHVDDRQYLVKNYVAVNAHELAHQWFGDYVTARSRAHHWLQESFATHYNMMWERKVFGEDFFDWDRREAQNSSLEASEKDYKGIANSTAGSTRHYPKGAYVLWMLKYVIGTDEYNRAVKHYLENHAYGNVDSDDLLTAFHEVTGHELDWFWDEWVYRGGEPYYEVTFQDIRIGTGNMRYTEFSITQVHEINEVVGLFKMPIVFEVVYTDGTKDRKKVWIENQHHTVKIPNKDGKEIDFVLFDPDNEVMKRVQFKKPFEMLKVQALKAEYMLDRYDALYALRDFDIKLKREVLVQAYDNESYHAVRDEIFYQLIDDDNPASREVLKKALEEGDPKTIVALLKHTTAIPDELLSGYEKHLKARSYEVVEKTLAKLCEINYAKTADYLEITKTEMGTIGRSIRIKWLEIAYPRGKSKIVIDELTGYVSESYEFVTRKNAARALQRLGYFDITFMRHLIDGVTHWNRRLYGPCGEVLKHLYNKNNPRRIIDVYVNGSEMTDEQRERVRMYMVVDEFPVR